MPDAVLSALQILTHLILKTTYEIDTVNYYARLTDEEIEAKRALLASETGNVHTCWGGLYPLPLSRRSIHNKC